MAQAANRSFFSRLTSPFSTRTRTLSEFYIKLEEPHRQYSPGDLVKGSVHLAAHKLIRITHLVVCLHGFIRVSKNGSAAAEGVGDSLGAGRIKRSGESLGNGYLQLFEDEVVLCGEGKLDLGMYNFEFILEFPRGGLPSSIDVREHISSICPPSSRVVTLEPISRRPRGKGPNIRDPSHREKRKVAQDDSTPPAEVSESPSLRNSGDQQIPPRSPAPSEVSGESAVSSSTGSLSFRLAPTPSIAKTSRRSNPQSSILSLADKTITATVELLRGGCLRGDTVPVRVSINHTKYIKSLHGIIITLYRQGRIDSHPLTPLPPNKSKEADRAKHEDYYPKTRTGLGALSLSSAGSSSVYRKDLAQTFAPLIIDPRTLSTVVMASVRVPEDAFPTIASVPGGMVAFRYYVEVVVDLGGKLAGQDRVLPRIGLVNMPNVEEGSTNMLAAWGGGVVETDRIRREKSVVDVQFEIVVGTKDSSRARGKRVEVQENPELEATQNPTLPYTTGCLQQQQQYDTNGYECQASDHAAGQDEPHEQHCSYLGSQMPIDVPPPEVAEPEGINEKTRLQNFEASLLPSAPPESEEGSPSAPTIQGPSAPIIPLPVEYGVSELHSGQYHVESMWALPPHHIHMSYLRQSAPLVEAGEPSSYRNHHFNETPQPGQPPPQTNGHPPTDDKHDLELRRLQAEASAPEDFGGDDSETSQNLRTAAPPDTAGPTAPIITEEDEYGFRGSTMPENLPRYER
ncbi:hypothetical protein FGG08_003898 [Glutinoglossum americanum]|uniref:Arrestin C-terminal-like domain-containing protein n=1 Tax=Glutinoglossum americanum TaxID=1670608 RepID=A0A9P8ICG9_9PEZI|nr:hypothetical protein FGG08_003898 [Glutinoglossum americanum]